MKTNYVTVVHFHAMTSRCVSLFIQDRLVVDADNRMAQVSISCMCTLLFKVFPKIFCCMWCMGSVVYLWALHRTKTIAKCGTACVFLCCRLNRIPVIRYLHVVYFTSVVKFTR